MNNEFPKAWEPQGIEKRIYDNWLQKKLFAASEKSDKQAYSILMPPPNVTGILHFGHVLNQTIQDLYIRYKRMKGYEVCWFPGTDHAGIATQSKVEAQLKSDGISRYDLGREKFVEKVWEWREKYGGIILRQLKELGISCDWDRTLFTMDESASNAVQQVFIRLFDDGLIYKGKRIINWSPLARTALSDEEVEFREVNEKLYTLRYYFENSDEYLQVATVRTETIFGDIAVAVNPNDERFKSFVGKNVVVPLVGRVVPVIADNHADPEFGTGCVKITPAHDPNDFEVGLRHNLDMINTINPDGTLNDLTGEYNGLERFEARKRISKKLNESGLVEKTEDYTHNVGYSQRGGEPVEPYLSDQWFVKMKPLSEKALKVVQSGEIKFHPDHWLKTYENWLLNIRDWCISRQLWWGHRIPVYYTTDGRYTAANNEEEARRKLGLDNSVELIQDEDVLDTWFSSWLWPMTTMHWLADNETEDTETLRKFMPTDLLVTAPDIIFFWVARMIMASEYFKNEIPFKDVYFTSTIRDGKGQKLSKSLGNSPDPLNVIAKYGADAVRFTMLYLSPLGQDIKMDVDVKNQDVTSVELGRNFANKIWNAGRFLLMKRDAANMNEVCPANENRKLKYEELSYADKWLLSKYNSTLEKVNTALENYKINEYSKILYEFIWKDFCDWYLEILKVELKGEDKSYNIALSDFAIEIYDGILKMVHPIMPFITEEIWHIIHKKDDSETICFEKMPAANFENISNNIEDEFFLVQMIVDEVRSLRVNSGLPPSQKMPILISCKDEDSKNLFDKVSSLIAFLGSASEINIEVNGEKPVSAISSVVREVEIYIEMDKNIDLSGERDRLNKEIERLERNISGTEKKLSNSNFVDKAPDKVVAYEREKLESMKNSLEMVKSNLSSLG